MFQDESLDNFRQSLFLFNLITPYSDYITERTTDKPSVDCHRNKKSFSSPKLLAAHRAACSIGTEGRFSWCAAAKLLTFPFTVVGTEIRNECYLLYFQCLKAFLRRDALVQLFEALRYKPEGRRFCSRCCLILTQSGIFSEEQRRSRRRAANLPPSYADCLESWEP